MARPNPASEADNDTPNSEDWQALRGELVALLDQVEQQVTQGAPEGPGVAGLSERMRDLREQVAGAVPVNRRRDALRSVQKAVERINEREEPVADPNPRKALQTAIDEIRSRQANKAAAVKPADASPVQSEAALRLAQAERDAAAAREALAREQQAAREAAEAEARAQAVREAEAQREAAEREAAIKREAERVAAERQAAAIAAEREAAAVAAAKEADARAAAIREAAAKEAAAKEAAARVQAAREQAAREQAEREAQAREQAAREAQARDEAARERAAREAAEREAAARAAQAREAAAREQEAAARERAAREAAERDAQARAEAAQERAAREEAARQLVRTEMARVAPKLPDFSPRFDELAQAVGGITGRLERLEGELKTQAGNGTVQEVTEQVAQLSHVVEALAAAVGETGQVKRLETQIAGLAKMLVNNQKGDHVDMVALTQRLDDVSATVERLADLQVQHVSHEREIPAQQAAMRQGIAVIEKSVRNVYDRIDVIEKNYALTPADFDKLQGEMAKFADAIATASDKPQQLAEMIDALHSRIATIESRDGEVQALKTDILALRDAVLGSVEPRFAAMEVQLEALNERIAARQPDIPGVTLIEAQVRQLVARMDQTGAQLSTLAKLYAESEERDAALDYEALADLVMSKTEEALARLEPPPPLDVDALATLVATRTQEKLAHLEPQATSATSPGFSDEGLAQLETRMSKVFRAASTDKEPEDLSDMQDGIRKVDERLGRLEDMLNRLNSEQKVWTGPEGAAAPRPVAAQSDPFLRRDVMPVAPTVERPLVEQPYGDPVRSALEARNNPRRHPGLDSADPPSFSELSPLTSSMLGGAAISGPPGFEEPAFDPPVFDPEAVERPPRPDSAFDIPDRDVFSSGVVTTPEAPAAAPASVSQSSRNTFMEAQRRAMQRHAVPKAAVGGNSLLSRALARFQNHPPADDAKKAAPVEAEAPVVKNKKDKPEAEKTEPQAMAEATGTAPDVVLSEGPEVEHAVEAEKKESFLSRHRQPILLALSVVALSFLTLNLINQRMSGEQDTVPGAAVMTDQSGAVEPGAETGVSEVSAPLAPVPGLSPAVAPSPAVDTAEVTTPRVIPMIDTMATGSIDPDAVGFQDATAQAIPDAFAVVPEAEAVLSAALDPAAIETPAATFESPVEVELPPEGLGPLELRTAAANGDVRAQFEVAAIYTEGRAVPQDLEAAATWYERAAAQGFAPAQYRLGNLYENGRGVEKDLQQAQLWYQRAAESGNRMSMHNLAALYAGGELGEQDFPSAAQWFEQAANQGMTDSQFNLGMLYARGLGVPQDLEASYKWFSLAAMSGDADAASSRDDVAKSLTPEAISSITDQIAAWKAAPINLTANFAPIGTWSPTFDAGPAIDKREVVVGVQTLLGRLGYDIGTADGFAGPRTSEAIRSFERATGMSETGQINPRLLAVLSSQPV